MGLAIADLEGKYEIVAKLKEGGMGAIYKVRHRLLEELRVVKVLRPQHEGDEELRLRLAREARSAIQLRHPNVVQIFDFSHDDSGVGLIIMEYIHGADLTYLLKEPRRPSLALTLEIARQSLRSLAFLHRQGFIHRDVSPDNLMLTVDVEGEPLIKLIDLGIAKNHEAEQDLTISGSFLGKFRYASPEHFGAKGPDGTEPRSDLYTFGLVLYELLTGRYPMVGDSTSQLIASHLFQPPLDFDGTDPENHVPKPVRDMVLRALEKRAEDRFDNALEWVREIEALQRTYPITEKERDEAVRLGQPPEGWARPVSGDTQWRFGKLFGDPAAQSDRASSEALAAGSVSSADGSNALEILLAGAEALLELGQHEKARQQVDMILGIDGDHPGALRLRQAMDGAAEPPPTVELPTATAGAEPPPVPTAVPPVFSATGSPERPSEPLQGAGDPPEEPVSATAVAQFDELLSAGRLGSAERLLEELTESHGAKPPLPEMRARLDQRLHEQLTDEVRGLLKAAGGLVEDGSYSQALEQLREAQSLAPATGPVHDELTRGVLKLQRKIEARERRKKVDRIEQKVLKLLRLGRLEEARDTLGAAQGKYGDDNVFDSLRKILKSAINDRQNDLGGQAGRAFEIGRYSTAIQCLNEMLRLDPESSWVRGQLDRAHHLRAEAEAAEEERRREEDERRTDFESLAAMVARDELDEAHKMLEILAQRWGTDIAAPWREKIDQRRRAGAQKLLEEAERARDGGDLFKARLLVAEACVLDPEDSAITLFARMLDTAAHQEVSENPISFDNQPGVLHTIAEIERLRVEGQPLKAWKALLQAIEHFGEHSELAGLRKELAEQILEESGGALG